MLSKEKVAHRLSRMLDGGRSRAAAAAVAFAALAAVVAAGMLLASRAADMRGELMRSSLVAAIATPGEEGRLSQILSDPVKSELLMKYINSMAGVVTNMEVSPAPAPLPVFRAARRGGGRGRDDFGFRLRRGRTGADHLLHGPGREIRRDVRTAVAGKRIFFAGGTQGTVRRG